MIQKTWDVLGFGAVAVDELLYVNRYPPLDSKEPVLHREMHSGGLAGTALVAVARLGGMAAYCGILGEDELSKYTVNELEQEGVDCSQIMISSGSRPIHTIGVVEKNSGSRTLFFDRSGVNELPADLITPDLISRCKVLFFDYTCTESGIRAGLIAKKMCIPVVVDLEIGMSESIDSLLPVVDHLVIGQELGESLTGKSDPSEMTFDLITVGFGVVVITAGSKGCWYAKSGGDVLHEPALRIEAVDTVGCGDVFHGAYALAIARGMNINRALRVATITAGLKTRQRGGRAGIPDWAEVSMYLTRNDQINTP